MGRARERETEGERETQRSLHLAISLPSLDPWPQCIRSRDHASQPILLANDTDRRDPRAHADGWVARYIIKTPSDYKSTYERLQTIAGISAENW